mmetsp:Transcript_72397/g.217529  ORF Transcript_72397/g.217529 Transcript_72397/m.217529 type:complete len:270 (+) Transcript_72397:5-814(+)
MTQLRHSIGPMFTHALSHYLPPQLAPTVTQCRNGPPGSTRSATMPRTHNSNNYPLTRHDLSPISRRHISILFYSPRHAQPPAWRVCQPATPHLPPQPPVGHAPTPQGCYGHMSARAAAAATCAHVRSRGLRRRGRPQAPWKLEEPCCPLSSGCSALSIADGASSVGRQPSASWMLEDAPLRSNASAIWRCSHAHAMWSGVEPSAFCASGAAPCCSRHVTTSPSPRSHARCSAVCPSSSAASTGAPASSSSRHSPGSPRRAAEWSGSRPA